MTGWTIASACLLFAIYMLLRGWLSPSPYDLAKLSETVTVRFTDTNDELTLTRGEFEKRLREVPGDLNATTGIMNPKTGKPSGILVATREWEETVNRINQEKQWARQNSPFGGPPQGAAPAGSGKR